MSVLAGSLGSQHSRARGPKMGATGDNTMTRITCAADRPPALSLPWRGRHIRAQREHDRLERSARHGTAEHHGVAERTGESGAEGRLFIDALSLGVRRGLQQADANADAPLPDSLFHAVDLATERHALVAG